MGYIQENQDKKQLIEDIELAISDIKLHKLEPEIINFSDKEKNYDDMTISELNKFLIDMHSIIFQSLSDEEQEEIENMISSISDYDGSVSELYELSELSELTLTEYFSGLSEHVSTGQRMQNRISRKTNFALKKSIAIRSKRNRELCKGEWSTWSKKQNKCVYKDKSKTELRKVKLGIKPRRYKG